MKSRPIFVICLILSGIILLNNSCRKPNELSPWEPEPLDSILYLTDPMDTCSRDTIYFIQQILPILVSNCSTTGCHDTQTAQKGIILTSYENMMRNERVIKRGEAANQTTLYKVLTHSSSEFVMPPLPYDKLAEEQIELIETWLLQGAKNNSCVRTCDTTEVSYSLSIAPIIEVYCEGCHSGPQSNAGLDLSDYQSLKNSALAGPLLGSITHTNGYKSMPPGKKLPECTVEKFRIWIKAGATDD